MKKNIIILLILPIATTIYTSQTGQHTSSLPRRGTAGNPTYKQRLETGLYNTGVNITSTSKNAWNIFITKAEGIALSAKELPGSLKTKYNNSDVTASLQSAGKKASQSIKDFWNTLTSSFSKKENFAIINQQTDSPDDIFSPLHRQEESENFTL